MNIDSDKLKKIIKRGFYVTSGLALNESTAIGELNGRQVILTVTKDEDDFHDEVLDTNNCLTE